MAGVHELRRIVAFDEMEEELRARGLVGVEAALPGMMDSASPLSLSRTKQNQAKRLNALGVRLGGRTLELGEKLRANVARMVVAGADHDVVVHIHTLLLFGVFLPTRCSSTPAWAAGLVTRR